MRLLLLRHDPSDLDFINETFEAGKIVPVIDRRYTLAELPDAFRYYAEGRVKGKIVINVH